MAAAAGRAALIPPPTDTLSPRHQRGPPKGGTRCRTGGRELEPRGAQREQHPGADAGVRRRRHTQQNSRPFVTRSNHGAGAVL